MNKCKITGICLLALLTACTERDGWHAPDLGQGEPIDVNCSMEQGYQTRVNDGGFTNGDAIGVYVVDYVDGQPAQLMPQGNHATNVKYTFNEDDYSWKGAATLYWTDKTTCVDAYSYYPFTNYIANVAAYPFTIESRQDKDNNYETSDFLWAKAEGVQPGNPIYLNHRHIMAGVQVSLVEGEDFNGTWNELEKSVVVTNVLNNAIINIQTGTVSVASGATASSVTPYKKGNDWRCVVAPQTVEASETLLSIVVDGESYKFSRSIATTFLPGKLHKFTIQVDKALNGDYQFSLIDEAITAWEADAMSHQAEAKVYTVIHVPDAGSFQSTIESSGINIKNIKNLKLTGTMNQADFDYFSQNFSHILALNMKELRTKDIHIVGGQWWGERAPGYGVFDDNHEITPDDRFDDAIPSFLCRGDGSFKLRSVIFPDKLKYIGVYAFHKTPITGNLDIPEGVVWMGDGLVGDYGSGTYHITKLTIPSTVVYIGKGAIGGYETIGGAFSNELVLPVGLRYLGESAFSGCRNTSGELHLLDKLEFIGEEAFRDVPITGNIHIPAGIQTVTGFTNTKISGVYIPEGAKEIAKEAFWQCSDLSGDIYIPSSVKAIKKRAFAGTAINHITLPKGLDIIDMEVFAGCHNLSDTLTIPEGVKYINRDAFNQCINLDAIILPSTVEVMGGTYGNEAWEEPGAVFSGCNSLCYLRCDAKVPPTLLGEVFIGIAKDNFTLVVPEESIELYQQAEGWREFKRISAYRNFVMRPQIAKVLNKGGKREVVLNCDADKTWSVASCPDWMHIDKTSGKGKSTFTITIDAMEHGHANRSDKIVLKMGNTDYTTSFTVSQFDYEYNEDQDYTMQNHSKGSGIPLVFVGDGYDAEDIANGTYLADMKQSAEYFFDVEPYKTYRGYFDVYTAFAMSYESGIGSVNYLRNVKFGTECGDGATRMYTDFDAAAIYCLDHTPVTENNFDKTTCVIIPNTGVYDGVTSMFPNGTAVALCPKSTKAYPFDARGLIQHEAGGHGFGKLADEYIYHAAWIQNCACICCEHVEGLQAMQAVNWGMNLSLSGKTKDLPWQHLLHDWRTSDIVDVWEGGFFHSRGVYRSEYNSCMNNNVPYFSTWSRELIVQRIMQYAGETYNYEEFVANDNREWGKDFTLGTRAMPYTGNISAPAHGRAPILKKSAPKRNNK